MQLRQRFEVGEVAGREIVEPSGLPHGRPTPGSGLLPSHCADLRVATASRSRGWLRRLVVLLAWLLGVVAAPGRASMIARLPTLTHADQIRELSIEDAERGYPVRIRGGGGETSCDRVIWRT